MCLFRTLLFFHSYVMVLIVTLGCKTSNVEISEVTGLLWNKKSNTLLKEANDLISLSELNHPKLRLRSKYLLVKKERDRNFYICGSNENFKNCESKHKYKIASNEESLSEFIEVFKRNQNNFSYLLNIAANEMNFGQAPENFAVLDEEFKPVRSEIGDRPILASDLSLENGFVKKLLNASENSFETLNNIINDQDLKPLAFIIRYLLSSDILFPFPSNPNNSNRKCPAEFVVKQNTLALLDNYEARKGVYLAQQSIDSSCIFLHFSKVESREVGNADFWQLSFSVLKSGISIEELLGNEKIVDKLSSFGQNVFGKNSFYNQQRYQHDKVEINAPTHSKMEFLKVSEIIKRPPLVANGISISENSNNLQLNVGILVEDLYLLELPQLLKSLEKDFSQFNETLEGFY